MYCNFLGMSIFLKKIIDVKKWLIKQWTWIQIKSI